MNNEVRAPEDIQEILRGLLIERALPVMGTYAIIGGGLFGIHFADAITNPRIWMSVMSEFLKALSSKYSSES
jgi:hypothetical protein